MLAIPMGFPPQKPPSSQFTITVAFCCHPHRDQPTTQQVCDASLRGRTGWAGTVKDVDAPPGFLKELLPQDVEYLSKLSKKPLLRQMRQINILLHSETHYEEKIGRVSKTSAANCPTCESDQKSPPAWKKINYLPTLNVCLAAELDPGDSACLQQPWTAGQH